MGKIHFLKPEDFERQAVKSKKAKNYKRLCLILATCMIVENILILWLMH